MPSTPSTDRPLLALRLLLAVANTARRLAPARSSTVAQRRVADARSLLGMATVTRRGRGRGRLRVVDHRISDGVGLRRYRPVGADGPLPTHVLIHGGCYWAGSVDAYDPICRWYAGELGVQVFSVDYRLAPEHPFPAGVEDCYTALVWVADRAVEFGVDLDRFSIGGISAGGGLAAAVALLARDRGGPVLCAQVLEIPMLDPALSQPSVTEFGQGYGLTSADLAEGWRFYLPDGAGADPYAGPFGAADLSGLPPAIVLTDGSDPLRDEGEAYAARLGAAGVPVQTYRARGHVHASHYLTRLLPSARRAVGWTTEALADAYG